MIEKRLEELIDHYPCLAKNREDISRAYAVLEECIAGGGKILIAGNGGSAADADHIVGELMKGFYLPRRLNGEWREAFCRADKESGEELYEKLQGALPAIALHNHPSLNTAFANDVDARLCFAQQVFGYGTGKDVLWVISTSGNSANVVYAAITARAKGLKVIGLTGEGGGKLSTVTDVLIAVQGKDSGRIQELHLPVYHCLCRMLEERFFETRP